MYCPFFNLIFLKSLTAAANLDRIIDQTIDYCRQRHTFGSPLISNQVIHFRLAELKSEVELLRSLVYRAAGILFRNLIKPQKLKFLQPIIDTSDGFIEGEDVTYLASIAKLKSGRLAREVVDSCLQYFGGMGYTQEMLISRAFRDSRVLSIAGGTDEIMLGIICKFMDILPKKKKD
jgi:citronellyl-CoA dehydrogenase